MTLSFRIAIDLGGAPVAPVQAEALGLVPDGVSPALHRIESSEGFGGSVLEDGQRRTIFHGHIDDLVRVSHELGAAPDRPLAELARLAFDRWGKDIPAKLPGEWVLLDAQPGAVALVQSAARLIGVFHSRHGNLICVSSDIAALARLPWVGRELDEAGFLFALGRASLRAHGSGQTFLRGVSKLQPGETVCFTPAGTTSTINLPFVPVPRWEGSIVEAAMEAEALLQAIIDERLERHGDVACLLSGGLDSSLLTMLVSERLRPGQRAICLTSVAPPGSGLADELAQASLVAERLGFDLIPVVPGSEPGIYRPDPKEFAAANGPSFSVRHYLYRALADQAAAAGAAAIFDGAYGEMTVTGLMPLASPALYLRQLAKRLLGRGSSVAGASPFHVRLAPHRLQDSPAQVAAAAAGQQIDPFQPRHRRDAWGYFPGVAKTLEPASEAPDRPMLEYPFRDPRLLQMFAGFPAKFLVHEGLNRSIARIMMAGRLPDAIRLRTDTMPFSPDYMARLQAEAPLARSRIAAFRKADIADWLDLDWLDTALQRFAAQGANSNDNAFEVQLTAMAAEFLLWWRSGGS